MSFHWDPYSGRPLWGDELSNFLLFKKNHFEFRNHHFSELCPKSGFLPTTAAYLVIWLLLVCVAEENNGDGGDEEVDHAKVGVVHREEY